MIVICENENCKKKFNKPDWQVKKSTHNFCSRKCSNIISNTNRWKNHISSYRKHPCIKCQKPRGWRNESGLCNDCFNKTLTEKSKSITLRELKQKHNKRINGRWYSAEIRSLNKSWNFELTKKPCQKCGFSHHSELCHIKAIKDFDDNATLGEINNPSNIVVLCPNCHWLFDNKKLVLPTGIEPVSAT